MAAKSQDGFVFLDSDHKFIREKLERKLIVEKVCLYLNNLHGFLCLCRQ